MKKEEPTQEERDIVADAYAQGLALIEAERLDAEDEQKRLKTRPARHDKLRGSYGQRK